MKRTINLIGKLHHKNIEGAKLFNSELFDIEFDGESTDIVFHCSDISNPIGNLDIYGPQIDFRIACQIIGVPVNFLSDWNSNMAKMINPEIDSICLPFPVNIENLNLLKK
jgi:hypothetical protein